MSKRVVVVGANRGIGLELVRAYQSSGDDVIALARKASPELKELGVTIHEGIDVGKPDLEKNLAKLALSDIDILIHNSGILEGDSFPELEIDSLRRQFEVNSLGPLRVVLALRDGMARGGKIGLVTSRVGSIADNSSSNNYGYRTSKTALNMIGKCLSLDLRPAGVSVGLLHPGYVKTDMTGGNGLIEADESAAGLVKLMNQLNMDNSGGFWHTNGVELPW